jgi:hypothetical protein
MGKTLSAFEMPLRQPRIVRTIRTAHIPKEWTQLTRRPTTKELITLANEVNRQGIDPSALNQVREVFDRLHPVTTRHKHSQR